MFGKEHRFPVMRPLLGTVEVVGDELDFTKRRIRSSGWLACALLLKYPSDWDRSSQTGKMNVIGAPSGPSAFSPFLEITGFRGLRDYWHGVGGPDGASPTSSQGGIQTVAPRKSALSVVFFVAGQHFPSDYVQLRHVVSADPRVNPEFVCKGGQKNLHERSCGQQRIALLTRFGTRRPLLEHRSERASPESDPVAVASRFDC